MDDRDERTQAYGRLKARVSALDMTMARFAAHVGTTASKASLWRSRGVPGSVLHALDTLERTKVASAIWTGRRGGAPKVVDAMDAMGRPFGAVIDDAVAAGWSRKRIAEVMRRLSEDLDREAPQDPRTRRPPVGILSASAESGPFLADLMEQWDQEPSPAYSHGLGEDVAMRDVGPTTSNSDLVEMLDRFLEFAPPPVRRPIGFASDIADPEVVSDGGTISRGAASHAPLETDVIISDLLDLMMEEA